MIRLTELRLPLDHEPAALRAAIVARLGVADHELTHFNVFRRAWDARRRGAIVLIYTVDCALAGGEPAEQSGVRQLLDGRRWRLRDEAGSGEEAGEWSDEQRPHGAIAPAADRFRHHPVASRRPRRTMLAP